MLVNWIVSLSNYVFGLPVLYAARQPHQVLLVTMTIAASFLMHISETKHGLPGVYPFNQWSWYFLQFDRVMAIASGGYVLYKTGIMQLPMATIGFVILALSERVERGHAWFAVTHILWHACAFYMLYNSMQYT